MSEAFNPFAQQSKYTREQVSQIFGPRANGTVAHRLKKENPELYREVREAAVELGILASNEKAAPSPQGGRLFHTGDGNLYELERPQRNFSEAELRARARYSEKELAQFFLETAGSKDNPAALKAANPAKYEEMRLAAVSYGLLPEREAHPAAKPIAKPTPESDGRFALVDEVASVANLPKGYRVNVDEYRRILEIIEETKHAKEQEAKERLAAENAAAVEEK